MGDRRSVGRGDRRRLRRHVGRRVRQRHAAVEVAEAGRRLRPSPYLHRSRIPIRRAAGSSASACSTCRARAGTITIEKLISKGGGVFPRTEKSISLSPEARAALGIQAKDARSGDADQRGPEGARSTCSGSAASAPTSRPRRRARRTSATLRTTSLRADASETSRQGHRRRRESRDHPGRPNRIRRAMAAASTPTSSTIARASTAPTMR